MKKIEIKELILIGVGIFALCFAISKFVFCKFNMTSDYLTASATFFATVIALYLYNDWREPYNIQQIGAQQLSIMEKINLFRVNYFEIRNLLNKSPEDWKLNSKAFKKEFWETERNFFNSIESLLINLRFYQNSFFYDKNSNAFLDHKLIVGEAISQIEILYADFLKEDSILNFEKTFEHLNLLANSGKFINVVNYLSFNLNDSFGKFHKELITKKVKGQ